MRESKLLTIFVTLSFLLLVPEADGSPVTCSSPDVECEYNTDNYIGMKPCKKLSQLDLPSPFNTLNCDISQCMQFRQGFPQTLSTMFTPRRSAEKSARTRISASSSHTSMPPQAPSQTFVKASRPAIVWSHVKIVSLKTWIVSGRVAQILLVKWTKILSMVCLESSQNSTVKSCASKLITAPGTHYSSPTPAISMTSASS